MIFVAHAGLDNIITLSDVWGKFPMMRGHRAAARTLTHSLTRVVLPSISRSSSPARTICMASLGLAKTGTVPTWVLASLRLLAGWSAVVAVPDGSPAPGPRGIPGFDISQTVIRFYTPAMTFPGTTTPGKAEKYMAIHGCAARR